MNGRLVALFVLANLMLFASPAAGQGTPPARVQTRTSDASTSSREYTFTDQLVEADLPVPNSATVRGNVRHTVISLIPRREHFVSEMFKSVENL